VAISRTPSPALESAHGQHSGLGPSVSARVVVWPGLMLWAIIVFFIAGTHDAPTANNVTPVDLPRKLMGYFAFLLLLLIIVPVPHALYESIGVHGPYL
jgi:hypothetical protein